MEELLQVLLLIRCQAGIDLTNCANVFGLNRASVGFNGGCDVSGGWGWGYRRRGLLRWCCDSCTRNYNRRRSCGYDLLMRVAARNGGGNERGSRCRNAKRRSGQPIGS